MSTTSSFIGVNTVSDGLNVQVNGEGVKVSLKSLGFGHVIDDGGGCSTCFTTYAGLSECSFAHLKICAIVWTSLCHFTASVGYFKQNLAPLSLLLDTLNAFLLSRCLR
jgi:hypothetical protein